MALPFWLAFWILHAARPMAVGMAVVSLGIPYTEITTYARDQGLPRDEAVRYLRALDRVYLEHANRAPVKTTRKGKAS